MMSLAPIVQHSKYASMEPVRDSSLPFLILALPLINTVLTSKRLAWIISMPATGYLFRQLIAAPTVTAQLWSLAISDRFVLLIETLPIWSRVFLSLFLP